MDVTSLSDEAETHQSRTVTQDRILVLILRLGALLCFAGWSWQHLYWEGPLGVLLWQDSTFEFAESLGYSWEQFVGTGANDGLIQRLQQGAGWLLVSSVVATLFLRPKSVFSSAILLLGTLLLGLVFYAKYLNSQEQLPMLIEHGGQLLAPVCLWLAINLGGRHIITISTVVAAVILTFAGHGCYAIGAWPTPSTFFAMTTVVLGTGFETTQRLLYIAGVLDFVVCVGLLIPYLRVPLAVYACVWGLLTAIARPVAGMSVELNYWGADQFLHEAIIRAPHSILPMYLVWAWVSSPGKNKQEIFEDTQSENDPHD